MSSSSSFLFVQHIFLDFFWFWLHNEAWYSRRGANSSLGQKKEVGGNAGWFMDRGAERGPLEQKEKNGTKCLLFFQSSSYHNQKCLDQTFNGRDWLRLKLCCLCFVKFECFHEVLGKLRLKGPASVWVKTMCTTKSKHPMFKEGVCRSQSLLMRQRMAW